MSDKISELEALSQKDFQALELGRKLLKFHQHSEMITLLDKTIFLVATHPNQEYSHLNHARITQNLFFIKWIFEEKEGGEIETYY